MRRGVSWIFFVGRNSPRIHKRQFLGCWIWMMFWLVDRFFGNHDYFGVEISYLP